MRWLLPSAVALSFTLPTVQALRCNNLTDSLRDTLHWEVYARVQSSAYADSGSKAPWWLVKQQAEPFMVAEGTGIAGQHISIPEPLVLRHPYYFHVVTRNPAGYSCISNIVGRP